MIIFDLDGTLVDSRADLALSVNLMRKDFGFAPFSEKDVISFVGNGVVALMKRSIENTGIPLEDALKSYTAHYAEHLLDNTRLYDGMEEALRKLAANGIAMAVVTNKPEAAARSILEGLGVLDLFCAVIGGGSGCALKPEPDALLKCLEISGDQAGTSWMVGDHYTDLEAGRRAGMKRAFCLWGIGAVKEEKSDADLAHPLDMLKLISGEKVV